jgi:hypothetical protein
MCDEIVKFPLISPYVGRCLLSIVLVVLISTILQHEQYYRKVIYILDRLYGLMVRVSGYRSRGPGFDSGRFHIF